MHLLPRRGGLLQVRGPGPAEESEHPGSLEPPSQPPHGSLWLPGKYTPGLSLSLICLEGGSSVSQGVD